MYFVNPAAAGMYKSCLQVDGLYQKQWFGMDKAPTTQLLSLQTGLNDQLGSGTYVFNDRNGYYQKMGLQQSLSYEILLSKNRRHNTTLHFGLSLNLEQVSLTQTEFTDGAVIDPTVSGAKESGFGMNANSGIILKVNQTQFGVSLTNMIGQTNKFYEGMGEPDLGMDINFFFSTLIKPHDRDLFIEPLLYYRRNTLISSKVDLNVKLTMPTTNPSLSFWGLLAYRRTMDSRSGIDLGMAVTAGVIRKRFSVGLEYQFGLTSARNHYGNVYQLVCGYRFCRDKSKGALDCPEVQR
jgi:type IX secretion system PorP/SprF family membrane protein